MTEFDLDAFRTHLLDLNPWARGLPIPGVEDWDKPDRSFLDARKDECRRRLNGGIAIWNKWAKKMLGAKGHLEQASLYSAKRCPASRGDHELGLFRPQNDATALAIALLEADFVGAEFGNADFKNFVFTGHALFVGAKFKERASFEEVFFKEHAHFREAWFEGVADFESAHFEDRADFRRAVFKGVADFRRAKLFWYTDFSQVDFQGNTNFTNAEFDLGSSFRAAQCREGAAFSLGGVRFERIPDFIQANFSQPPRLDNVEVQERRLDRRDPSLAAKWRNLKRLAIQAHDHEREVEFFAREMRALRRVEYPLLEWRDCFEIGPVPIRYPVPQSKPFRYFANLFYQFASNYGRSAFLPVFWWGVLLLGFAVAHVEDKAALATWPPPQVACVAGEGDQVHSALRRAASKAFVLPTSGAGAILTMKDYACLYGIDVSRLDDPSIQAGSTTKLPVFFRPNIPWHVPVLETLHLLLSTVLIFLFALALRNQFRIK